jgi:hypothetical protein
LLSRGWQRALVQLLDSSARAMRAETIVFREHPPCNAERLVTLESPGRGRSECQQISCSEPEGRTVDEIAVTGHKTAATCGVRAGMSPLRVCTRASHR